MSPFFTSSQPGLGNISPCKDTPQLSKHSEKQFGYIRVEHFKGAKTTKTETAITTTTTTTTTTKTPASSNNNKTSAATAT